MYFCCLFLKSSKAFSVFLSNVLSIRTYTVITRQRSMCLGTTFAKKKNHFKSVSKKTSHYLMAVIGEILYFILMTFFGSSHLELFCKKCVLKNLKNSQGSTGAEVFF